MGAEARVCFGEHPKVYEASGPTPAATLRAMADMLETAGVDSWLAARLDFDYESRNFEIVVLG